MQSLWRNPAENDPQSPIFCGFAAIFWVTTVVVAGILIRIWRFRPRDGSDLIGTGEYLRAVIAARRNLAAQQKTGGLAQWH
jgi:hypothetical protein